MGKKTVTTVYETITTFDDQPPERHFWFVGWSNTWSRSPSPEWCAEQREPSPHTTLVLADDYELLLAATEPSHPFDPPGAS